jgi:predicted dehydrogenase
MSDPLLRTAVIGLGRIGFGYHCPEVAAAAGFALTAVSDPLPERLAEAHARWGVRGFADLAAMLTEVRPDLVVIASPTRFHRAHAEAALAAGAHVFCDKPVVESVAEFDPIVAAAGAANRRFVAYQPRRFAPEVSALREILRSGVLGRIHLVKRARCNFERRQDWQAWRANGGGMLNNYGAHCLDELLSVFGESPIARVFCETRCAVTAGDAEDVVKALLTRDDGLLIDLEISQASALPGPEWEISGANGAARWEGPERGWHLRRFHAAAAPRPTAQRHLAADGRRYQAETLPWADETVAVRSTPFDYYQALRQHLVAGGPAPVTLDETRALLTLIERCRRSAETRTVT